MLGEVGVPIKGLYAAGRTAIGLPSKLYVSGLSAADCVFSGRRAARHASGQEIRESMSDLNEHTIVS